MINMQLIETACPITDKEEALRHGAGKLHALGLVTDEYADAVVGRERIYPTGIESHVNFSICHTDVCHSVGDGLCVLVLNQPIEFHNMADMAELLDVRVIFMLASTTAEGHMRLLQDIIAIMSDGDLAIRILSADGSKLMELFQEGIRRN